MSKRKSTSKSKTKQQLAKKLVDFVAQKVVDFALQQVEPREASLWAKFAKSKKSEIGDFTLEFEEDVRSACNEKIDECLNATGVELVWRELCVSASEQAFGKSQMYKDVQTFVFEHVRELARQSPEVAVPSDVRLDLADIVVEKDTEANALHYRNLCEDAWKKVHRDVRRESKLPTLVQKALLCASEDNDYKAIVQMIDTLAQVTATGSRGLSKLPLLGAVMANGDPGLFLDFARGSLLTTGKFEPAMFLRNISDELKTLCPRRDAQIEELVMAMGRRLLGDNDCVYPLLFGPPGTGKTFLVELLADVCCTAGLKATSIVQPMTQLGGYSRQNNEIAMALQGTSAHWGEGHYGMLFREAHNPELDLCLTILDEADKCDLHEYLVTLLDPRQPLQDSFIREFMPKVDMRHRVLFFLTANDASIIARGGGSPLWSRLYPIEMPAYSRQESIELICKLVGHRKGALGEVSDGDILSVAESVIGGLSGELPSLRTLLDRVKRRLFQRAYPFLRGVEDAERGSPQRRTIGFSSGSNVGVVPCELGHKVRALTVTQDGFSIERKYSTKL